MSVRKRTWITSKGEHKEAWVVDYEDQTPKRRLKTFAKKKAADNFAATANVEIRAGIHTADSASKTIAEAGKLWLETGDKAGLERSTLAAYRQHLKLHIAYLGNVKLSQLSAPMVREFEDKLARGDMPDGASPQPRTRVMVRKVRVPLSSLLGDAQERGLVSRKAVRDLRRTRARGVERKAERRQKGNLKVGVDIPTREEIKAIVEAAKGRWRPILLTAIFTGLRASELRGLLWKDVNFEKRELHVRQRADRYSAMGKPKSESGERTAPLTPIVVNTLRDGNSFAHRARRSLCSPQAVAWSSITRTSLSGPHPDADCGRRHGRGGRAGGQAGQASEVHRPSRTTSLLRLMVHHPPRRWRPGTACQDRAGTPRPFVNHDDDGCLRPSLPAGRRLGGAGGGGTFATRVAESSAPTPTV